MSNLLDPNRNLFYNDEGRYHRILGIFADVKPANEFALKAGGALMVRRADRIYVASCHETQLKKD